MPLLYTGESGLKMKALYDYTTDEERCLSLTEGEIITNVSLIDDAWASGRNFDGTKGLFPLNHCEVTTFVYFIRVCFWIYRSIN